METKEFGINQALGKKVFEEIRLDGSVLPKGHVLNEEDIIQLKLSGIKKLFAAETDENDLSVEIALGVIAAKLCGDNTAYAIGENGLCKIVAAQDGVFLCSDDRVAKFNRNGGSVILNTIEPYAIVREGTVIAELEMTLPAMPQAQADEILYSLPGNTSLLAIEVQKVKKTALVYTQFYNDGGETAHFTAVVKKLVRDFAKLRLDYVNEYYARHTAEDVANAIEKAVKDENNVIFIIPGIKGNSPQDVIPSALRSFVDEIVCLSIPQVGASDLIIASKRDKRIISLPFHYDSCGSRLADHYIKLAVVNEKLHEYDFARPQNVLLEKTGELSEQEKSGLIAADSKMLGRNEANIAAVVLAAGAGRRAGRNKLLAEMKDGRPLFMKAVRAAMESKAGPVFVVTGDRAEELSEFMEDIDVNVIYNPSYRAGVRTSIALGLKSVPGFCEGALLLPADMPCVDAAFINKMVKAFRKGKGKQVVMASKNGVKHNPVIWSRELFDNADMVPENADLRPIFMEHEDYTVLVEPPSAETLTDITFPSDLDKITGK